MRISLFIRLRLLNKKLKILWNKKYNNRENALLYRKVRLGKILV